MLFLLHMCLPTSSSSSSYYTIEAAAQALVQLIFPIFILFVFRATEILHLLAACAKHEFVIGIIRITCLLRSHLSLLSLENLALLLISCNELLGQVPLLPTSDTNTD